MVLTVGCSTIRCVIYQLVHHSQGNNLFCQQECRPGTASSKDVIGPLDRRQLVLPVPVASFRNVTETLAPEEQCLSGKTHH